MELEEGRNTRMYHDYAKCVCEFAGLASNVFVLNSISLTCSEELILVTCGSTVYIWNYQVGFV